MDCSLIEGRERDRYTITLHHLLYFDLQDVAEALLLGCAARRRLLLRLSDLAHQLEEALLVVDLLLGRRLEEGAPPLLGEVLALHQLHLALLLQIALVTDQDTARGVEEKRERERNMSKRVWKNWGKPNTTTTEKQLL
jgi:hypothetical protein